MTGIVGPNGCGKTNILDALRWVLGEQRTSMLRGAKMEEVIFNGSRDAKPMGMSEVSLTIANSHGTLPTEYTDLTVTRRLYRSGESEYRMNKQPCRLRDILDLFADTGMGAHAYSVIQQDMIDAILSDKAEERRFLFEEAAGITKYKHRKKAALRKLQATEADLLRLKDIAAEVRTRVISLKRQSNKAERYQQFKERWQLLHLRLARSDYETLQQKAQTQDTRARNLKADLEAARAQVTAREAEREAMQADVEELERHAETAGERVAAVSDQLHAVETEWEKITAQRNATAARQRELVRELELLAAQRRDREERIGALGDDIERADADAKAAKADADALNTARTATEAAWQSARARQQNAAGQAEEARARCRQLESEFEHAQENITALEAEKTDAADELERLKGEALKYDLERQGTDAAETQAAAAQKQAETSLESLRNARDDARTRLQDAEQQLKAAETRHTELESQHQILASWEETYRGYHGAVPALLGDDRPAGLADTVAQLLHVESGYEVPVAAALSERAEYLVCNDRATADELLQRLETLDVGRANLIILDAIGETAERPAPIDGCEPLANRVQTRPGFETLARFLLDDFFLWTGEGAPDIAALPRDAALVTQRGRMYRGTAEAAAGRSEAVTLLARKDELERLAQALAEQEQTVQTAKATVEATYSELESARQAVRSAEATLAEAQEAYRAAGVNAERNRARAAAAAHDVERSEEDLHALEKKQQDQRARLEELTAARESADRDHNTAAAEADAAAREFEAAEKERTAAMLQAGEAQVKAVSLKGRLDGLVSDRERTREMLSDIQNRIAAHVNSLLESGRSRREASAGLQNAAAERQQLLEKRAEVKAEHGKARELTAAKLSELHELERAVKAARKELDTVGSNHHAAEMAASEARLEVAALVERVRETHNVELSSRTDLEPVDPNQHGLLAAEARELKERLDGMGTVNLLALDEYNEQKERLDFLDGQLADLEGAKKTLEETITRINETARTLFSETFEKVQANFQELFTQLFEGGEASVFLDVEDDPLESPISITARPRGKRPVSILQLSGGERALTAIALLFSLYMVKPSPFCILDEIDAPLDDANIGRFLTLLNRFSKNTQFIIITHNKMTMQATDVLYGVTMQSPGISKVVSVQLNEAVEVAAR